MSNAEAKIKITVENQTAAGFNAAASSAAEAGNRIKSTADKINSDMRASMDKVGADMRASMDKASADMSAAMSKAGENVSAAMKQVDKELENVEAQAKKTTSSLGAIGTALVGMMSIGFAKYMAETADRMQAMNSQVKQVTSSNAEYTAVQKELLDVANRTTASLESTTKLYVSTSRALQDYGYTQQEVLKFTEATNNAMTIGGVEAQQQAAALMQLSQALGSGVLQGDEFKSIAEAAPILLDTIAEYMGKSRAEIKKLGSEGQLTADVIFKAISGASDKFAEKAAKMPTTMGQALTVFQNNWSSMVSKIMNDTGVMSGVASVIKLIADNLNFVIPIVLGLAAAVAAAVAPTLAATAAAWGLNAALLANPIGLVVAAIGLAIAAINEFGEEIDVFGGGWSNLQDVVQAVWEAITETIGEVIDTVKEWFGEITEWLGEKVGGWEGLFEKVMSFISSVIGGYVNAYINTFATGWMLIKEAANNMPQFFSNLGATIGNVFISAIEWMINKAIGLINGIIDYANKAAAMVGISGIEKLNNVSIGKMNDGGLGGRIAESMTKDRAGAMADAIRERAADIHEKKAEEKNKSSDGKPKPKTATPNAAGGGRSGRKSGGGRSGGGSAGRAEDPMSAWEAEIKAQKLAHNEMRIAEQSHADWDLAHERDYWSKKLSLVDFNGKTGLKIREKIADLEKQLAKQTTEYKLLQVAEWEKTDKFRLDMEVEAADQALAMGKISQLQRLDAEIEFENQRYQIAFDALQERIALAQQDPTYSETAIAKLQQQAQELSQQHELKQAKNGGKREQQRRKDAPSMMEMLEDGGKNVWQSAQQNMSEAFNAMLNRTQSFSQAMQGFFKSTGQAFIQEMVTKPLAGLMQRLVQESAIYKMIYGTKDAMETASSAKTAGIKAAETSTVVGANAVQAASGAAASQSHIPIVGPMLAMAAMAAMMAAVNGLMGGGGSSTTTTTTRIPSAAGGWDIPAGINPLTQLHENEMVLPAEHAQTIRDMAGGGGGGGETVIINTTGGDFIHKKDLAKLLKQMNRDFKIT